MDNHLKNLVKSKIVIQTWLDSKLNRYYHKINNLTAANSFILL